MEYPKLKFALNKNLDKKVVRDFLHDSKAGVNFGEERILQIHPEIRKMKSFAEIDKYIDEFYYYQSKLLYQVAHDFQKCWQKVEKDFFKLCDKQFNHLPWPKGKYIAYISMFNCGPRFLDNKTFQIFYWAQTDSNFCIIHEMLHFQFYHYFHKKLKKYYKIDKEKIWELSEIFDSLVMWQDKDWKKLIYPIQFFVNYPDFAKTIENLKPFWLKHKSIPLLFKEYFK